MMNEITYAKEMLCRGGYTLVVCNGGRVFVSEDKGIKPLLELVKSQDDWSGAYAADKIVGKAAAMLYTLLKVKAVYAEVLSEKAKEIFEENDIEFEYDILTENIINRQSTGLCPMEEAVKNIDNAGEAVAAIEAKIAELKAKRG
ncbi:MAG: DUF1893 domain-containing protein [Ruminococcus sp.]|nr:DUF1893 domain-containing protein [Ruminococcus sp.]